jgi:hypothetical protein
VTAASDRVGLPRMTAWALAAVMSGTLVSHAQSVPTLALSGPQMHVGVDDVDLHGVSGAGLLADGRIVVGDRGNSRVVVFDRAGKLQKSFGREGNGPGDFASLQYLTAFGDTIVTWDSGQSRITLWTPDGKIIRSVPLPSVAANHVVHINAVGGPLDYIATISGGSRRTATGLFTDTAVVLRVDGRAERPSPLGSQPWKYSYFQPIGSATTTWAVPFLGETLVAISGGKILTLPLGESTVSIARPEGKVGRPVTLPVARAESKVRARNYTEALIASVKEKDRDPAWMKRLRVAFGPDFPYGRPAVAERAVPVGSTVWYQVFSEPTDRTTTWFIVDAVNERLAGRVALPKTSRVLGGNGANVLVMMRDADGVESVGLFSYRR